MPCSLGRTLPLRISVTHSGLKVSSWFTEEQFSGGWEKHRGLSFYVERCPHQGLQALHHPVHDCLQNCLHLVAANPALVQCGEGGRFPHALGFTMHCTKVHNKSRHPAQSSRISCTCRGVLGMTISEFQMRSPPPLDLDWVFDWRNDQKQTNLFRVCEAPWARASMGNLHQLGGKD